LYIILKRAAIFKPANERFEYKHTDAVPQPLGIKLNRLERSEKADLPGTRNDKIHQQSTKKPGGLEAGELEGRIILSLKAFWPPGFPASLS